MFKHNLSLNYTSPKYQFYLKYVLNVVLEDCFTYNIIIIIKTTGCPLPKLDKTKFINCTLRPCWVE